MFFFLLIVFFFLHNFWQVSYFEIYLDKIRDLLDGTCANIKHDTFSGYLKKIQSILNLIWLVSVCFFSLKCQKQTFLSMKIRTEFRTSRWVQPVSYPESWPLPLFLLFPVFSSSSFCRVVLKGLCPVQRRWWTSSMRAKPIVMWL